MGTVLNAEGWWLFLLLVGNNMFWVIFAVLFWKAMRRPGRMAATVLCVASVFTWELAFGRAGYLAPALLGGVLGTVLGIGTGWLAANKGTKPVALKG